MTQFHADSVSERLLIDLGENQILCGVLHQDCTVTLADSVIPDHFIDEDGALTLCRDQIQAIIPIGESQKFIYFSEGSPKEIETLYKNRFIESSSPDVEGLSQIFTEAGGEVIQADVFVKDINKIND